MCECVLGGASVVLPSEGEGSSFDADLMAYSRYVFVYTHHLRDKQSTRGGVRSLQGQARDSESEAMLCLYVEIVCLCVGVAAC